MEPIISKELSCKVTTPQKKKASNSSEFRNDSYLYEIWFHSAAIIVDRLQTHLR
jgi:hypothetical protein